LEGGRPDRSAPSSLSALLLLFLDGIESHESSVSLTSLIGVIVSSDIRSPLVGFLVELVLHLQYVRSKFLASQLITHFFSFTTTEERILAWNLSANSKEVKKMVARSILCSLVSLAALAATAQGFNVAPQQIRQQDHTSLNMGFGDAFKGAFSNDDTLGAKKNEGLAGGPNYNESVTINGKAVKGAVVGQKLTVVAGLARVKIPVNCQKGDCGTCEVNLNGRKVKACQTVLGKGKCAIQTL
jgi:ferredoxin